MPHVHNTTIDSLELFYREAGNPSNPTVLLLHGFPSSSHQFRHLMPILAAVGYHVLAPDYPGFGFTTVPASRNYTYTFDNLAHTTALWLHSLNITSFAAYVFDYGAPVGFRLATSGEFTVKAIVTQNGNAYTAGLGPGIQPLLDYGAAQNATTEAAVAAFLTPEATKSQYTTGAPDPSVIEPESYVLDVATALKNPDVQLKLFKDYKSNVALYPAWQAWMREHQPKVLAIWGEGDPIFIPPGAEAFKDDVKDAEVALVPGPHFLLETALETVAERMVGFLRGTMF